jgi:hypothetical protein
MIEVLKSPSVTKLNELSQTVRSDQSLESVALAGAAAIERIINERDGLRGRVCVQEDELNRLGAVNEDLRRYIAAIRDHYVGFAMQLITQLEQFDRTVQAVLQKAHRSTNEREHATLISMAQRFSPACKRARDAMDSP